VHCVSAAMAPMHHLFAYTKVLSQTAKDKKVLSLTSVVTLDCLWRAQTFYMHIFAKIARFLFKKN